MPPKKSTTAAPKKASGATPAHASYQDMVKEAILNLKERNGSSRQAIKKYIQANNNLGATTDAMFSSHLSRAIAAGEKSGEFSRPKGMSSPVLPRAPSVYLSALPHTTVRLRHFHYYVHHSIYSPHLALLFPTRC
ncbi:hypothetical protein AOQ84DRAFT_176737 [Glonium stellatum]|uniref:Histone H1 n=1 Tax=Glonium stellatum TaxID=574774 RepID=A0A8E2EPP9_9PEZI|nr:hypothetical protein AOQ84DRAFT_176737 [Glonium stellatum]